MSGKLEVRVEPYTGLVYERVKWADTIKWPDLLTGGMPVGNMTLLVGHSGSGKSMFSYDWWLQNANERWNKLIKKNGGVWLVTISIDVGEKIQWLRDSFGEGSNYRATSSLVDEQSTSGSRKTRPCSLSFVGA
jgi:hypothetical protein